MLALLLGFVIVNWWFLIAVGVLSLVVYTDGMIRGNGTFTDDFSPIGYAFGWFLGRGLITGSQP
jgi:hypothetical protein